MEPGKPFLKWELKALYILHYIFIHSLMVSVCTNWFIQQMNSNTTQSLPNFHTQTVALYQRSPTFLLEGHIRYCTAVRGPDILRNIIVSRYVARPVTRGAWPPYNFFLFWKNVLHIIWKYGRSLKILDLSQKTLCPAWCPKLLTGLSVNRWFVNIFVHYWQNACAARYVAGRIWRPLLYTHKQPVIYRCWKFMVRLRFQRRRAIWILAYLKIQITKRGSLLILRSIKRFLPPYILMHQEFKKFSILKIAFRAWCVNSRNKHNLKNAIASTKTYGATALALLGEHIGPDRKRAVISCQKFYSNKMRLTFFI